MGRGLLSSQLQIKGVFICVLAPDLFFSGPIVFEYMICLSIAIQNLHLMRYIWSLNTHTISLHLPLCFLESTSTSSLSLSPKGKGMLGKESSQVTVLRYGTMLSSSSLALSLSLSQRTQLSPYSQSLYSTKSRQHRTKCSSKVAPSL